MSARFTNEAETFGEFVRPGGQITIGPLPPEAGDIRAEYDAWIAGGGAVEPYTAPPTSVPSSISDRQFFQQLALDDVISEEEAEAAVATGTIPAAMLALIDALPEAQRFGARMMLKGATVFERHHPLTVTIGTLYGWTEAEIDQLFQNAAAL